MTENSRVTGMVVRHNGRDLTLRARKGVVLATGGFSSNAEWRKRFYPQAELHQTVVAEGNTADGLQMALDIGATLQADNAHNGVWQVVSKLTRADGTEQICPHFFTDIPKPGCIAVNTKGQRFGNEANLELGGAMHDTGSVPAWLIVDHRFIRKYGLGLVYPWGIRLRKMLRAGYLSRGGTLSKLGDKLGIDGAGLERSVVRYNELARKGKDSDFGKGDSAFDRTMGDPAHQPQSLPGAHRARPVLCHQNLLRRCRLGGRPQCEHARAAAERAGTGLEGLYVCGLDMNSLWSGTGLANGAFHSQNMTFGYIIAASYPATMPSRRPPHDGNCLSDRRYRPCRRCADGRTGAGSQSRSPAREGRRPFRPLTSAGNRKRAGSGTLRSRPARDFRRRPARHRAPVRASALHPQTVDAQASA